MTGVVRKREMTVLRWVFFSQLLLGITSMLFGLSMVTMFHTTPWNDFYIGMISVGTVWFCAGSLGLIASHMILRGRFVRTMRSCEIALVALSGLWLIYFWLVTEYGLYREDFLLSSLGFCSVMTATVVIASFILSLETESREIQIGKRLVVFLLLICTMISYLIICFDELAEFDVLTIGLVIGWTTTIIGLATISIAVRRENQPRGKLVRTITRRVKMKMTCPQCQQWLEAASGPARCDGCGLRMIIEIKEPRCVCGYLLYELQGNVCPECGREIENHESMKSPFRSSP